MPARTQITILHNSKYDNPDTIVFNGSEYRATATTEPLETRLNLETMPMPSLQALSCAVGMEMMRRLAIDETLREDMLQEGLPLPGPDKEIIRSLISVADLWDRG